MTSHPILTAIAANQISTLTLIHLFLFMVGIIKTSVLTLTRTIYPVPLSFIYENRHAFWNVTTHKITRSDTSANTSERS